MNRKMHNNAAIIGVNASEGEEYLEVRQTTTAPARAIECGYVL